MKHNTDNPQNANQFIQNICWKSFGESFESVELATDACFRLVCLEIRRAITKLFTYIDKQQLLRNVSLIAKKLKNTLKLMFARGILLEKIHLKCKYTVTTVYSRLYILLIRFKTSILPWQDKIFTFALFYK